MLFAALSLAAVSTAAVAAADLEYVSPRPGADVVSRGTTIAIRPGDGLAAADVVSSIKPLGSASGLHAGSLVPSANARTVIFYPDAPFHPGETVRVTVGLRDRDDFSFEFRVSTKTEEPDWMESTPTRAASSRSAGGARRVGASERSGSFSLPEDFPTVTVLTLDNPAPGFLFLANRPQVGSPSGHYGMILDDTGFPQWFALMPETNDFKRQPTGQLTYFDAQPDQRTYKVMDSTYTVIDVYEPGNGYPMADSHDFQFLPNGNALFMIIDHQPVDMSQIVPGGCVNAIVRGHIVQEHDTDHNVVFEWRSWDHFAITEAIHEDLTSCFVDAVHTNSIEPDFDGNLLLSNRNLDDITKVNRATGEVMWRLGGPENDFTLVGDTQFFTYQHSARRTAAGTITVFDNGCFSSPQESRAVEFEIDETNLIATRVWEFRHDPPIFAPFTGNTQRLPNGNTLISWGSEGIMTEVRSDGSTSFEMRFDHPKDRTYRAFRLPWSGAVAAAPTLWSDAPTGPSVTLHFTKFGDGSVVQYNIYRGPSPEPTTMVGSTSGSSFILNASAGEVLHVRVTAEGAGQTESPYSNELEITMPVGTDVRWSETWGAGAFVLHQNQPNPFAAVTSISFELSERMPVEISVYDVCGRLVRTVARGAFDAGRAEVVWNSRDSRGRAVGSGVYFARLKVGDQALSRTMTLRR
jgi:hypothetical protein